ncbi:MAG: lauroyl acyltransferase [Leptospiraceae bacterium]|jgi:KDO2-lipid IV(A) lauroyltransferase|nr:lauroyl acyltransferase [Leptospiraceae bacterium]
MKKIGYFISFLFAYFLYLPFKFLPYKVCLAYGVGITRVLFPLARKHRRIAYDNISYAFPNLNEKEKLSLVKRHFDHLGRLLAGTLYASRLNQEWMDKYLSYEPEFLKIEQDTNKEGIGVVLVSGHLGTWEILVQFMGLRMKGAGIYKKIRNPFVDKWVKSLRENNGILLVTTDESSRVMKLLKDGYWIGFGSDQNAGKAGIFVNFFNRPASTYQGPALMAYLTGAKLLLYSVVCGEDGKVIVRVKDMGVIDKKKFPSRDMAVRHYTEMWTRLLEEEVKLFPEQYFWVHRRWRTKPGDFPGQI